MNPRRVLLRLLLTLAGCALTGCQSVAPWERGTLADRTMRPDLDPLRDAQREHVFFSREAHAGGRDVGGGGCGCN